MDPSTTRNASRSKKLRRLLALLGLGLSVAVGCALFETKEDAPPEKWDAEEFGPVVPHKNFPANCDLCHETGSWTDIKESFSFDHGKETGTALLGAHARASCLRCHNDRGPVTEFSSKGCGGCHVDTHKGALGSSCDACHNERNWRPEGMIAQHLSAGFPLYGSHAAASCDGCHPGARSQDYAGAPDRCIECHLKDQQRALAPNHVTLGYTECEKCHKPTTFKDARFSHDAFPLTGAHATADCAQCHGGGVFAGTPSACVACHAADYAGANNPTHTQPTFPDTCQDCHNTTMWSGGTFTNHPAVNTGPHSGVSCNQCHTTPGDFMAFSCITSCHSQGQTDSQHSGVGPTYMYDSAACFSCHPNGRN